MRKRASVRKENRQQRSSRRRRRGFTIIELLVALVLLDIALLTLVGLVAASVRDADDSRRRAAALRVASARLEQIASLGCRGSRSDMSRAGPGLTEWYAEIDGPNETRVIRDSVVSVESRGVRATVLLTGASC